MYVLVGPDDQIVQRNAKMTQPMADWLNTGGVKEGFRWLPYENLPDEGSPTLAAPFRNYSDYVVTVEENRVTRKRTVSDKSVAEVNSVKQQLALDASDLVLAKMILLMLNYMRVSSGLPKGQFVNALQAASTSQGAQLIDTQNLRTFIENNL